MSLQAVLSNILYLVHIRALLSLRPGTDRCTLLLKRIHPINTYRNPTCLNALKFLETCWILTIFIHLKKIISVYYMFSYIYIFYIYNFVFYI